LPDVVTTAKGLGNGVPIGACLARGQAAEILQPGNHGSTFGGNPLVCNAALAATHALLEGKLIARAEELGNIMLSSLKESLAHSNKVVNIRGKGLMLGIELNRECPELVNQAKARGILLNVTAGSTIRLLPPLILSNEQAQEIVQTVVALVEEF